MNTEDKQPKDDFVYFNDEWNTKWVEDPLMFPECSPESLEYNRYKKLIKNDKPDGRRYKK